VLVLPTLELEADDGPTTVCWTGTGSDVGVGAGVLLDVLGLVLIVLVVTDGIVRDGIPATFEHKPSNVLMMVCAEDSTEIEGSSSMEQLMQVCILATMTVLQRQLCVVQDEIVVTTDVQSELHYH